MRKLLFLILLPLSLTLSLSPIIVSAAPTAKSFADIVVQTIPGQSLADKAAERAKNSLPWYIVRGAGIIAAISLVILMLSGLGMISGHTFKFLEPLTAWASHRALGIVFGVSVLIHMFGLLFDSFVPFDIPSLFIPWLSNFKPVEIFGFQLGSVYIALGIIAFYIIALIVISSLVWIEKAPKTWKFLHLLSYLAMLLVFVHALYLGTDLSDGLPRLLWILVAIVIAIAAIYRLWMSRYEQ